VFTARMLGEERPFGACDDPAGIVGLARWVARVGRRAVEIMDRLEEEVFLVLPSGKVVPQSSLLSVLYTES
jgi:hypothetical protein